MFVTFLILSTVTAGLFVYLIMKDYASAAIVAFVAAVVLLFVTAVVHFDSVAVGEVQALKSAGLVPLSNSQVYEMSKKELDKCKSVYTFNGVYYFVVEEK